MKIVFVRMLITAIFGLGIFVGTMATGVSISNAVAISGGFSYISWRIDNKNE